MRHTTTLSVLLALTGACALEEPPDATGSTAQAERLPPLPLACSTACRPAHTPSCRTECADGVEVTTCGEWGYCARDCDAVDELMFPDGSYFAGGPSYAPIEVAPDLTPGLKPGGAPAGRYDVWVTFYSPRRYAWEVDDRGEDDPFCQVRDADVSTCPPEYVRKFDGVRLWHDSHGNASGLAPAVFHAGSGINGPHVKTGTDGKREWEKGSGGDSCRAWTDRDDLLFTARYDDVVWTGSAIDSVHWVKWQEGDKDWWNDHSKRVYFDMGNALTACLQAPASTSFLTPAVGEDPYYTLVCDEDGGCFGGDHFTIQTYLRAYCHRQARPR